MQKRSICLTRVLGLSIILHMYASPMTATMKMPWILLILVFPVMGLTLYLMVGLNGGTGKMRKRYEEIDAQLLPLLPENEKEREALEKKIPRAANISAYIKRNALYPVYQNTDVTYYDEAEKGLEAQLEDLCKGAALYFYGIPCDRGCRSVAADPACAGGTGEGRRRGARILR